MFFAQTPHSSTLFIAALSGIVVLLLLVMRLRVQAFVALMLASLVSGLAAGMDFRVLGSSMQNGMATTLGGIAAIIGLGSVFGKILEASGGAESLARFLLRIFGQRLAPWALMIAGFLISIPVFLDVAFVLLIPVVFALARESGKSLLHYAIPLLAGLAVSHSFIPPTPGPVAATPLIGANIGLVILYGTLIGIPCAILAGPVFGSWIGKKITLSAPASAGDEEGASTTAALPSAWLVLGLILLPIAFIMTGSLLEFSHGIGKDTKALPNTVPAWSKGLILLGSPVVALITVTLLTLWLLGTRRGMSRDRLMELSTESLGPAGLIILVTGAGGVFKQVLTDSGAGKAMADGLASHGIPYVVLAWLFAAVMRVLQGSATVAMTTAAGFMGALLVDTAVSAHERAIYVIATASGATILSHVNDSGFWLVSRYLHLSERDTLKSWTVMETIIGVTGLVLCWVATLFV